MATMFHKGCRIEEVADGYVWEEMNYGAESDDVFPTVEAAKADIDSVFGDGPAPAEIDGELYA